MQKQRAMLVIIAGIIPPQHKVVYDIEHCRAD